MFLVLSKLLPLFIYPLGLTCVLLGGAIASQRKHPRRAQRVTIIALMILLISANALVAQRLLRSLESQYPPLSRIPNADAIVILGGVTRAPDSPRPWVEVSEGGDRVLYGAKLYRDSGIPQVILSGGRIGWQGGRSPESEDMATLIEAMGVPSTVIRQDRRSLNTHDNAVNVRKILRQQELTGPLLLVTSALHMPRAMAVFEKLGMRAIAAPTDFLTTYQGDRPQGVGYLFQLLPDVRSLENTTTALKEYVGWFIYRLRGWL